MGQKKLVIIGGGFAGLDVAREIGRSHDARAYWDTVLIDKENFFQFNPLLPSVAVGAVETRHIVYPLREMAQHHHVRFQKNKAIRVDLHKREILLHNNLIEPYDTLVISAGSVTNYYGVPGAEENTRPFKTITDAMYVRARVVELFEMAEQAETDEQRRRLLSFVIVGGGVTGAEVAAELTEMARETLLPRYPHLQRDDISITILEGGDRIVPTARPKHSAYIHRFLEHHGVRIELKAAAQRVELKRVIVADGRAFDGFTILWTAGVCPPDFVKELPLQHIRDGRVRVDDHLRALKPDGAPLENLYVLGDCAASLKKDGTYQPALSQTGIAMGTYVGEALVRQAKGEPMKPFGFQDAGYIISLGKHSSVVDLFGIPISGKIAWLLWAAAYLVKMVGFRKQIEVGIDHITHFFFEHDTSQILNRRAVLTDEELNLSLAAPPPAPPPGRSLPRPASAQGANDAVAPADLPEYLRGS